MSSESNVPPSVHLSIENAYAGYTDLLVVNGVTLNIQQGELICLLGPSGCGKSSLLRCIAGFHALSSGTILLGNKRLDDGKFQLPPEQRNIGMVFQDIALFPHLSVTENIEFGLFEWSSQQAKARSEQLLTMIGLQGMGSRYPHELSGGQQQRVALARALAPKPDLLLLDEPFSGLDAALRDELIPEIAELLKQEQITTLMVSHDQAEAFAFADRVAVMNQGKLEQISRPEAIYYEPKSRFVAEFIGEGEFIKAEYVDTHHVSSLFGQSRSTTDVCETPQNKELFIRPDDVEIVAQSKVSARVESKRFRGGQSLLNVLLDNGQSLAVTCHAVKAPSVGETIYLALKQHRFLVTDDLGKIEPKNEAR